MVDRSARVLLSDAPLGIIRSDDAGTITYFDTGYLNGKTKGISVPFNLTTANQRLTIQCDQAAYVLTDVYGVDAGNGIKLAADEKLTTSLNSVNRVVAVKLDGGTYTGGIVSVAPLPGSAIVSASR